LSRSISVSVAVAMFAACGIAAPSTGSAESATGLLNDVVFTDYTPLSSNAEIIRRLLSPLAAAEIPAALARAGSKLSEQPINLAEEKFVLYVPAREPAAGYGAIVFVPPWNRAALPSDWIPALDQSGVIFVSAARSGNDASVLGRRYPLALLGEYNVANRYRLDPQRVYIAGFSGGSRVALRLALTYPDVFRGAILNASGDPIGDSRSPLPPKDLFFRFQETMHLVYVTGEEDTRVNNDRASMRSMRNWCVSNIDSYVEPLVAHESMSGSALARALEFLSAALQMDREKLADCRIEIDKEMNVQLKEAESLIAAGKRDDARQKLLDIDARFGGLAAPRSVELFDQLRGK
jgi:pimeloyl-ACP methyl ester carboxylesterase